MGTKHIENLFDEGYCTSTLGIQSTLKGRILLPTKTLYSLLHLSSPKVSQSTNPS